jgi:uncharacterized membrane protein YgcG
MAAIFPAMHCPYCQSSVTEVSASCPRCGLTMDKATAFFGTVPRMDPGVSDNAGVLSAGQVRRIKRAVAQFERRFPQAGFTAALMALPKDTPGPTYTMWVFNRCHPAGLQRQGTANRHVLLLVDTAGGGAWMTLGYGLEPFVGMRHLQQCLAAAQPHFAAERWTEGVLAALAELEALLREILTALPRIFGLPKAAPVSPPPSTAW